MLFAGSINSGTLYNKVKKDYSNPSINIDKIPCASE